MQLLHANIKKLRTKGYKSDGTLPLPHTQDTPKSVYLIVLSKVCYYCYIMD